MAVLGRTRALRRTLLRSAPAALVSIGLLVGAGCGSSGDSGSDPRAEVEDLVRQTLTSGSSAVCQRAMTPRFLEQNFGGQGQTNTLEQCQVDSELPGEPFARQVSFRSVRVEGQNAVATISVTGGEADGSVIRIELVRERGRWMLDYFADIQIDRPRYDAAGRRDAIALGVPQREADCAVRRLRRFYSTDEVEKAMVAGKTDEFSTAQVVCFSRSTLVKEFRLIFRTAAPKDVPAEILDCVLGRLTKGASTGLLRALFSAGDELNDYFDRSARAAARACAKDAQAGLLPNSAAS